MRGNPWTKAVEGHSFRRLPTSEDRDTRREKTMTKATIGVLRTHPPSDVKGIEAAETLARMSISVVDRRGTKPMSGRVGTATLIIGGAAQGVGLAASVFTQNWWIGGCALVGLGLMVWCGRLEETLAKREGTSLGISGVLYTLLRGDAIKEEELDEMKRRGLEVNL